MSEAFGENVGKYAKLMSRMHKFLLEGLKTKRTSSISFILPHCSLFGVVIHLISPKTSFLQFWEHTRIPKNMEMDGPKNKITKKSQQIWSFRKIWSKCKKKFNCKPINSKQECKNWPVLPNFARLGENANRFNFQGCGR